MSETAAFVSNASKKEVVERLEKADKTESRLARVERSRKEIAVASAGMGAEAVGAVLGGVAVGYMQAHDLEEWAGLAAGMLGVGAGMKRLDNPTNTYYQVAFAASTGIAAAVAAGYARDYFSQGKPAPMT